MTNNSGQSVKWRRGWNLLGLAIAGAVLFGFSWMLAVTFGIAPGPALILAGAATAGVWPAAGLNKSKAVQPPSVERSR